MSSHIKHHHARASQELAQPIGKASREDSSIGEQGCSPNLEKICHPIDEILYLAVDIAEKKWPKYDSQALKDHIEKFIKEHASHRAADDASKSDENVRERKIERISKIITKEGDEIAHELATKIKEVGICVHDVQANKDYLHELGVQVKASIQAYFEVHTHETVDKPVHETVDDKFDEVDEIACKDHDKVSENPFDEFITNSDAETDGTYVEVDDGATRALRKLVKQVAFEYTIEAVKFLRGVVIKREERREKKEEDEKYDFNFERFVELFEDPANFYIEFNLWGLVKLFKDTTNFYATINVYADFDFYADFGFEGFVELFEDEDDYVMVDHNTMMPSVTDNEVLATEVTEKVGARTRTWWFFW